MAERGLHSYPPVGDPDRLDAIMSRGRSMRRRRQLGVGAGAGGAALAMVFGVVFFAGTSPTNDNITADSDREPTTSVAPTTTSTTPPPTEMQVRIEPGATADQLTVTVVDPEQPAVDSAVQCLTVSVLDAEDLEVATGWGCNDGPGDSTAAPIELALVDPMIEIGGCGSSVVPSDPEETEPGTRPATTTFELLLPELSAGTYTVDTDATSGRGDGCPGTDPDSDEIENQASISLPALEVP